MPLSVPGCPAANHCALPLKGRLILAFLRALVGAFKAGQLSFFGNAGFARVHFKGSSRGFI
jgi:hypothetical protein